MGLFLLLGAMGLIALGFARFHRSSSRFAKQLHARDLPKASALPDYLAKREAAIGDVKQGQEKQIHWAGKPRQKTKQALVYIHGFSASLGELSPLPENLAGEMGTNLFFTRLPGHGRPGQAMGETAAEDWAVTLAEALEIGRQIGEEVIVMSASTGCTLVTAGLQESSIYKNVSGLIFVSPNFGLHNHMSNLAHLPFARFILNLIAPKGRSWTPRNKRHEEFWTTHYPLRSIIPMMQLIAIAKRQDVAKVKIPALFYYSPEDQVVDTAITKSISEKWGGQKKTHHPKMRKGDDENSHVIAGEALSPSQTGDALDVCKAWVDEIGK